MRLDLSPLIDVTFTRISDGTILESRTLPANAVVAGVQDDVPIARAQLTNNEILLDETIGMKVGDADAANDDFNPTTTVDPFNNIYGIPIGLVQNAKLIDTSSSEMGADAKNATMTHLLKITNAVSGLQTTDGTPINLFLESNGDITGRAGDVGAPAVFAIRMNPNTGAITVAQYGSIKQFDTSSYDEAVDLTGRISAVVTAKDSDGDVSNVEIPIGQLIIFEDDGPSVTMTVSDNNAITLNTQDAETIGGLSDSDSASFAAAFAVTPNYGADGAGTTVTTYALSVSAQGVDSGLDNNGNNIYLYNIAGSVVGSTSATQAGITTGNTIFSLGVNSSSGVVTLTQHQEVDHGLPGASSNYAAQEAILNTGLVFLNATAVTTDGDGDTATASASLDLGGNVKFDDDGPSVTMTVSDNNVITLNTQDADTIGAASDSDSASFAAAFAVTPNYGADGAGTTVTTYALSVSAQGWIPALITTATTSTCTTLRALWWVRRQPRRQVLPQATPSFHWV
ncbi:DUF5801 domain-containing protein [Legionella pneumophila]|nr:DUF5801 domain-containing protein [Legionella pneumophila]